MLSTSDFRPDWASPPGDTIRNIMNERGMTETYLSDHIQCSPEDLQNLLQGRMAITISLARKLTHALGASVEFWMSRDFQYREDAARLAAADPDWLASLPLNEMIANRWLGRPPTAADEMQACLKFFDVPNLAAWRERYGNLSRHAAFRTSASFESNPAAVAAWIRQGERQAASITCVPWNPMKMRGALDEIRALTHQKDPERFLPRLQQLCANCGVAVVTVKAPTGCRASGAVRFLSEEKALIQLSFRYLSDDHFWFTFFHEVGHLLLHKFDRLLLEWIQGEVTDQEREANEFSANVLVPEAARQALFRLRANAREVIRFAVRIGIAPGIVVGQLQHFGIIGREQLNGLKRRYKWR